MTKHKISRGYGLKPCNIINKTKALWYYWLSSSCWLVWHQGRGYLRLLAIIMWRISCGVICGVNYLMWNIFVFGLYHTLIWTCDMTKGAWGAWIKSLSPVQDSTQAHLNFQVHGEPSTRKVIFDTGMSSAALKNWMVCDSI